MVKIISTSCFCFVFIFTLRAGSATQQNTIRGRTVDGRSNGIPNVRITIRRGAETIAIGNSQNGEGATKGSYFLSFPSGGTIEAVVYGNSEYGPNTVFNISGETDHNLTKVLSKNQQGVQLSVSQASEVLASLDYLRTDPQAFERELVEYAGTLKEENVPMEFRPRLREFEAAVAKLPKQGPQIKRNQFDVAGSRRSTEATIKGKRIQLEYGSPSLKDGAFGQLPSGAIWRLGMNQATRIETAGDLSAGGQFVKAGKYTLWVKKGTDGRWTLAFHPKTEAANGNPLWGAPPQTGGFIAEFPLKLDKAKDSVDQLTISLTEAKGKGRIEIHLGTDVLVGAFDVN
jgi:hypothetical protein